MSGFLRTKPLILRACEGGIFGKTEEFPGGTVAYAMFLFLSGHPNEDYFFENISRLQDRPLVCMNEKWEEFLSEQYPNAYKLTRWQMIPRCEFDLSKVRPLPDGYEISPFKSVEFAVHPFSHGANYRDAAEFEATGSGAVARCGAEIVSSASSFLSYQGEVELDVSTNPDHRRKHLAENCVAQMLRDCAARGITVHWDAQNTQSRNMALKFGFEIEQEYTVYVLPSNRDSDK